MIAVVGLPLYGRGNAVSPGANERQDAELAAGLPVEVAAAAVAAGSRVELVGKVGDDGAGDSVVLALGRQGVGHAALLRDAAHPTPILAERQPLEFDIEAEGGAEAGAEAHRPETAASRILPPDPADRPMLEAGDIELALRYLADVRVVVLAGTLPAEARTAADAAARFSGASLIALVASGERAPDLPEATVLECPADDDGSFARLVGRFAAGLDAGSDPAAAFREAVAVSGWESVRR